MMKVQCDKCKAAFRTTHFGYCKEIQEIRISIGNPTRSAEVHICKPCLEELGFHNLISKAEDEPEPLIEALRELVREEIEADRE